MLVHTGLEEKKMFFFFTVRNDVEINDSEMWGATCMQQVWEGGSPLCQLYPSTNSVNITTQKQPQTVLRKGTMCSIMSNNILLTSTSLIKWISYHCSRVCLFFSQCYTESLWEYTGYKKQKWYLLSSETSLGSVPVSSAAAELKKHGWRNGKSIHTSILVINGFFFFHQKSRSGKGQRRVLAFQRWAMNWVLIDGLV